MDMQTDEFKKYLNKETSKIITVSTEDLSWFPDVPENVSRETFSG